MTRKDYIRIAAALKSVKPDLDDLPNTGRYLPNTGRYAWGLVVYAIARALAEDNPRFNEDRFREACGQDSEP